MDDAFFVGGFKGFRYQLGQAQRLLHGDRAALELIRERFALDELENQELTPRILLQPVNRPDAGVVERRQHLGFALEAGQAVRVRGEMRRE